MSNRSHSIGAGVLVAAVLVLLLAFSAQARTYGASDDLLEASLQEQMAARGTKAPAALEWTWVSPAALFSGAESTLRMAVTTSAPVGTGTSTITADQAQVRVRYRLDPAPP